MRVRANGLCLPDLDTLAAMETGRYWTPAKRPGEPLYCPAINNGLWAEDIITNGLVLYVPCWLYSGGKFPSVDAYHHTCTVTGATWGLQGRTFNGTSAKILIPDATSLDVSQITAEIWIKWNSLTDWQRCFCKGNSDITTTDFTFEIFQNNADQYVVRWRDATGGYQSVTGDAITTGVWDHIALTKSLTTIKCYHNLVAIIDQASAGAMTVSTYSVALGCQGEGANYANCVIGEARLYNRALSLAELTHNRNATRWRYA